MRKQTKTQLLYKATIGVFLFGFALTGYLLLRPGDAQTIYTIPGSISHNCAQEVSQAITDWLASVPDGSTIRFGKDACYRNERYIRLDNRKNITIDGNNATFRRTQISPAELSYPHPNPHWWFQGGSNITVKNLKVEGTNTVSNDNKPGYGTYKRDHEFESAFRVRNVHNSKFDNIHVHSVWGDGFTLHDGDRATVTNSSVDRNGRQGIAIVNISNVLVEKNRILHSRRAGIDLENDLVDQVISNIEIRDNYIESHLLALPAAGPGAVNNVSFHDNVIGATGTPFVYNKRPTSGSVRRYNWKIYNNVVKRPLGSPQPAIVMHNTENIEIRNNTVPIKATQSRLAVQLENVGGTIIIRDNYFENALAAYTPVGSVSGVMACSNKLAADGSFDQPEVCPKPAEKPEPKPPSSDSGGNSNNRSPDDVTSSGDDKPSGSGTSSGGNSQNPSGTPEPSDAEPEKSDNTPVAAVGRFVDKVVSLPAAGSGIAPKVIVAAIILTSGAAYGVYRLKHKKRPPVATNESKAAYVEPTLVHPTEEFPGTEITPKNDKRD